MKRRNDVECAQEPNARISTQFIRKNNEFFMDALTGDGRSRQSVTPLTICGLLPYTAEEAAHKPPKTMNEIIIRE